MDELISHGEDFGLLHSHTGIFVFKIVILWEIQRMDCKIMKTMSIVINPRRNHKDLGHRH